MRFLHTGDLHFGRKKHSTLDVKTGLPTSLVNDMEAMEELVEKGRKDKVDVAILAGDIYDSVLVSNAVRREVVKKLAKILETMHLVYVVGTHDRTHDSHAAHTLSDLQELSVANDSGFLSRLHIYDNPSYFRIEKNNEIVQFMMLPEPTKANLDGMTYMQFLSRRMEELVENVDPNLPCIVVGHFHVDGAMVGDEQIDIGNTKERVNPVLFDRYEFIDYVALGHIHKNQVIGEKIHYPGSLNFCSFTEIKEEKGFWEFEIKPDKILNKKYIKLLSPNPLIKIEINITKQEKVMEFLRQELSKFDCSKSIVSLSIKVGKGQKALVDTNILDQLLKESIYRSYHFEEEMESRVRNQDLTEKTTVLKAFETVVEQRSYEDIFKEKILIAGKEVIKKYMEENN